MVVVVGVGVVVVDVRTARWAVVMGDDVGLVVGGGVAALECDVERGEIHTRIATTRTTTMNVPAATRALTDVKNSDRVADFR